MQTKKLFTFITSMNKMFTSIIESQTYTCTHVCYYHSSQVKT